MSKQEKLVGKRLALPFLPEIRTINKHDRTIEFVASTEAEDRYGDVIDVRGWVLDNYKKNPIFLWQHQSQNPPVGASMRVTQEYGAKAALVQLVRFFDKNVYPFADVIFNLYADNGLRAVSVGFMPLEQPKVRVDPETEERLGYRFTKQELFELSAVNIPANPEALARALKNGLLSEREIEANFSKDTLESMKPVAYKLKGFFGDDNPPWQFCVPGITIPKEEEVPHEQAASMPCDRSGCGHSKSMHVKDGTLGACQNENCDCPGYQAPKSMSLEEMLVNSEQRIAKLLEEQQRDRSVCPFHDEKLAPKDAPWDASAEMAKQTTPAGWKRMSTVIVGDPANKTSYKLPHHKGDGFATVRRGVANALARLSNTSMSSADRGGARSHLAKHMKQFQSEEAFDEVAFTVELENLEATYSNYLTFKRSEDAARAFAEICKLCGADFSGEQIELSFSERVAYGISDGVAEFRQLEGKPPEFRAVTKADEQMTGHAKNLEAASAHVHEAIGYMDQHSDDKVKGWAGPLRHARTHLEKTIGKMKRRMNGEPDEQPDNENPEEPEPAAPTSKPTAAGEGGPNPGDGPKVPGLDPNDPNPPIPTNDIGFEDMLASLTDHS